MSGSRHSIDARLTRSVVVTSGLSLLVACLAFVAYDVVTLRRAMAQETATLAEVIGLGSAAALAFQDPATASETLAALDAAESVIAAVVYDREGEIFATHVSPSAAEDGFRAPAAGLPGQVFGSAHLDLRRPIGFGGERVGSIFIRADARPLTERVERYLLIALLLFAVATAVAMAVASRLRRRIARPLAALARGAEKIAGGDLSAQVASAGPDEIGLLARSFNAMSAGLRGLVGQVQQGIGDVSDVATALRDSSGRMAAGAQRQREAIQDSSGGVEQLGSSIVELNENAEKLAESAQETAGSILEMDESIAAVAGHMDHLAHSIESTSAAVHQVASNIDEVARSGDSLESATGETVQRLHELSVSVEKVEDNAQQSRKLSEDTSQEARRGVRAVHETILAMRDISSGFQKLETSVSRLASQSQAIDEILEAIGGVAEQTTLLSLNASIIAAQAGEHGKAFAVVAEQIAKLADRTHQSTLEIAQLTRSVQDQTAAAVAAVEEGSARVERGVQRSNEAGEVLDQIIAKSEVSAERGREIFEATERQSADLARVQQALSGVKEVVDRISRSARDQHVATSEIAGAVESIRTLGMQVHRSTEEQRRGSQAITGSMTAVAAMIGQIVEATQSQTKSNETIQHALQVFRDVSEDTTERAQAIDAMVATLSERSAQLENEIGRFKTK